MYVCAIKECLIGPSTQKRLCGDFPGNLTVGIWHFHCRVQSLVRELRFHKPHSMAGQKKKDYLKKCYIGGGRGTGDDKAELFY